MPKKGNKAENEGLSDVDESVLFFTRPYAIITLVCGVLSLFCMIYLRNDTQSASFVLSALTFILDFIFLIFLYLKAKRVRKK
ncbi:MAG: hypothetical protein K0S47_2151 [Herbinix sp.]|jgi:hypothetical protein|nr:hypothetical protein [Herbinix sp.]